MVFPKSVVLDHICLTVLLGISVGEDLGFVLGLG